MMPVDGPAKIAEGQARIEDFAYQTIKASMLHTQLICAREGCLDIDWRTTLIETAAQPINDIAADHQQIRERAAHEVANLPDADWEPDMKVGWRASLEAWHTASKKCLDDMDELEKHTRAESGKPVDDITERYAMERDLLTASYRAGLTAGGVVSDWYEWLLKRVKQWPDTNRRDSQLAEMDEPGYRKNLQKLPPYWA
ncbi:MULTISPECIES: hypothetical protein [Mycobacterium]|uniref:Uncharacterized protein n=1 Tax=Mycobacterium kyorinense TaxID=487514 RepID=A0A1X1YIY2_9MYCO|nr:MULTISPECIES: hypothetical protein [Mycobacterium]ORW11048.1 hypothetical protein AWC14_19205 [Mycobacterium kyorinense]